MHEPVTWWFNKNMHDNKPVIAGRRDMLKQTAAALSAVAIAGLDTPARAQSLRSPTRNMHLSLSSYSFRQFFTASETDLFRFMDWTSNIGVPGVELTSYFFREDFDATYLRDLRRCAFDYGMTVSGCATENNFCLPPGAERQREIDNVRRWIDHATILYAPILRIFAGEPAEGIDRSMAVGWVADNVRSVLDHAEDRGVILAMENHGAMTTLAGDHLEIVQAVGETPWFGITLDTGNYRMDADRGIDVYESIALAVPHAVNVHFKTDVFANNGPRAEADFERIRDILVEAGYRGWVVLEYESRGNPYNEVPRAIRELKRLFTA